MKANYTTKFLMSVFSILLLSDTAFAQLVACGGWHSAVICTDSTVKCFGENETGQLGNAANTDSNVPVAAGTLTGVIAVSAGGDQLEAHTMALKADGTVWAWGSNLYGGLGNGTTTNTNVPVQTLLLTDIVAITAGSGWHSVGLKSDSTVWAWGWNTDGQLGDNTIVDKAIAAQVPGLTGVVAIAAGRYHTMALKSDGTVWTWGDNVSGQIGNGVTGTDQLTPLQVSGLTNVVKIACGRFFSLALKSDSTLWTWGENLYGQLGDGTTTDRNTPVQVSGISGVTDVVCGAFEVHAKRADNTLWAWGRNTYGNLGDNTVTNRSLPVQMQNGSDVVGMASGTNFFLAYKTDGTLWGCGRNLSGQLGDGSFTQHNVLTQSVGVCSLVEQPNNISEQQSISVSVFPNPSNNGRFTVELPNLTAYRVEVQNLLGETLFRSLSDSHQSLPITIDLSAQTAGVYILNVSSKGQRLTQKLVKQ